MAGLSLCSNACPAKRPSLRACIAGMGFGGLIYQHVQTAICGYFERPTLRGCIFAANYGRVGASPQRLPCQKTKPKGLCHRGELCWIELVIVLRSLAYLIVKPLTQNRPLTAHFHPPITPSGLVLWQGSVTQSVNTASASSSIVNPLGLVFQNKPTPADGNLERPSLRACIDRMSFVGWDRIAFRSRIYM